MKSKTILCVGTLAFFAVDPAAGRDLLVTSSVNCPDSVSLGQTLTMDVHLESKECSPVTVRFFTMIVGNADGTTDGLNGLGIFGPNVSGSPTVVSAGTCPFPFSVQDLMLAAPQPDASLLNKVATYLLISESESGTLRNTTVDHCLVAVTP